MTDQAFTQPVSEWVWRSRYRLDEPSISATWDRVSRALASVENSHVSEWQKRFRSALDGFRFLPGGRILANARAEVNAGTSTNANANADAGEHGTMFNCFVTAGPHETIADIFRSLRESMITLSAGGGTGSDFSGIVPRGLPAPNGGPVSPGPVEWLHLWNRACNATTAGNARGGAMMATLRDDHPDIESFADAKRVPGALNHFNLSVLVSDEFMRAVREGGPWQLVYPVRGRRLPADAKTCMRRWSHGLRAELCEVVRVLPARKLWEHLLRAAYDTSEPGVIFIDHVRAQNNLHYCEELHTTNPCGEVPLPENGACNLGSLNLPVFVREPFTTHSHFDFAAIAATTVIAVRMLDNVYEASTFPFTKQASVARKSRRLGIGVTGLADAFAMLGLRYGTAASFDMATRCMATLCNTAYHASTALARERGSFPSFVPNKYSASAFVANLPHDTLAAIGKHGIRNSHLIAIAPAGGISLLANNVSSGIEPIFALSTNRRIPQSDGSSRNVQIDDYAWNLFRNIHGENASVPDTFVEIKDVDPIAQIKMQACLQRYVDSAISKTIAVNEDIDFNAFCDLYREAHSLKLKGCTVFRPNTTVGAAIAACAYPAAYDQAAVSEISELRPNAGGSQPA
jgi:ribonucleoside-diphosphate reductase alpha chain